RLTAADLALLNYLIAASSIMRDKIGDAKLFLGAVPQSSAVGPRAAQVLASLNAKTHESTPEERKKGLEACEPLKRMRAHAADVKKELAELPSKLTDQAQRAMLEPKLKELAAQLDE